MKKLWFAGDHARILGRCVWTTRAESMASKSTTGKLSVIPNYSELQNQGIRKPVHFSSLRKSIWAPLNRLEYASGLAYYLEYQRLRELTLPKNFGFISRVSVVRSHPPLLVPIDNGCPSAKIDP